MKISNAMITLQALLERFGDTDIFHGDMLPGAEIEYFPADHSETGVAFVHVGVWP